LSVFAASARREHSTTDDSELLSSSPINGLNFPRPSFHLITCKKQDSNKESDSVKRMAKHARVPRRALHIITVLPQKMNDK